MPTLAILANWMAPGVWVAAPATGGGPVYWTALDFEGKPVPREALVLQGEARKDLRLAIEAYGTARYVETEEELLSLAVLAWEKVGEIELEERLAEQDRRLSDLRSALRDLGAGRELTDEQRALLLKVLA